MGFSIKRWLVATSLLLAVAAVPGYTQDPDTTSAADSVGAPLGAQLVLPFGSIILPGLGQYVQGAPLAGAAFTATAAGGAALALTHSRFPERSVEALKQSLGAQMLQLSGYFSAYDSFRRSVRPLKQEGKYGFLSSPATLGDAISAPIEPEFLSRWTTWINLAYTAAVTFWVLDDRHPGLVYEPFTPRDAAWITTRSVTAGAGEEALFRGWLFPLFHQTFGQRLWLSNPLQAALFGALHPQAGSYAIVIAVSGWYDGWVTERNGWDIREAVFNHFWYDVAVLTGSLLTDRAQTVTIVGPLIRF